MGACSKIPRPFAGLWKHCRSSADARTVGCGTHGHRGEPPQGGPSPDRQFIDARRAVITWASRDRLAVPVLRVCTVGGVRIGPETRTCGGWAQRPPPVKEGATAASRRFRRGGRGRPEHL